MKKTLIATTAFIKNAIGNKNRREKRSSFKNTFNHKIKHTILFATFFFCGGFGFGQIAAWDFTSENNGTTSTAEIYNSNLDAGNMLTRGSGAAASTGANSFRTTGFSNDGISTSNNDYFETTISAATGYTLSLSTIDANFRGTPSFANSPGVTHQFAYSLDGTTFTLIGSPASVTGDGSGNAVLAQVSVSGISALQNLASTTTVTLRYYASGQTGTGGWGFCSASPGTYGLAIGGTVTATTACNAPAPSATGATVNNGDGAHLTVISSQGGTMSWYDAASGGTLMRNGLFYNTAPLTTTTTFWVDETVTGCPVSPRTAVVATVLPAFTNLHLSGNLDVDGNASFDGDFQLNGIPDLDSADIDTTINVLFVKGDGFVAKKPIFDLIAGVYKENCKTNLAGDIPAPVWNNGLNKIFTDCGPVRVGIGTSTPLYKLDVRGKGYFSTGIRIGTTNPSSQIMNNLASVDVETTSNTAPFLRFSHKTGTNAPQVRFRVENDGRLYCTSVWVSWPDSIPVPDYVFKPEYKLMPLNELKSYVAQNSHLPNIPNEAEIKSQGLSIEQMHEGN